MAHENELKWKSETEAQESVFCPGGWGVVGSSHSTLGGGPAQCWGPSELVFYLLGRNTDKLTVTQKVTHLFFQSFSRAAKASAASQSARPSVCPAAQELFRFNPGPGAVLG